MTKGTFAELFSDTLDRRGMSPGEAAAELARLGLKVHRGTLTRWRNGETEPSVAKLAVLRALPDAIGLSADEKAEFQRAAGAALGFPIAPERRRAAEPAAIPQRIHFGADDLPPFAGRAAELAGLQRLVLARRSVLITGLGGVGKTRLARELLRACAGYFTHGCDFLALTAGQTATQTLRHVAHLLGADLPPDSFDPTGRLIPGRLRDRLPGIDLLFLVDNVATAEQVSGLVHELPAVTWVFTARQISLKRDGVHPVHLGLPSAAGAAAMFQAHATLLGDAGAGPPPGEGDGDAAHISAIVERLGRLPIALRLASAPLANGMIATVGELAAWLERGGLLRRGSPAVNLRPLFDQMVGSVPAEAQALFETCGAFATRTINLSSLTAVGKAAGLRPSAEAREWLADFSLIDTPTVDTIELHPLLHDYARLRLASGPRRAAVGEAYREYYYRLCRAITEASEEHERDYLRVQPEEMNVRAVAAAFQAAGDWPRLKAVWPAISGYLWNTGNHADFEAFDRDCLAAAEATADEEWAAVILSELGFVSMERGDWPAAEALFGRSQALYDADADRLIEQARLRRYRATLALRRGETDEALRRLDSCAARLARLSNPPESRLDMALVLFHSARMSAHHCRGELALAAAAGAEADRLYYGLRAGGRGHRLGEYRLELGDVGYRLGDFAAARRAWEAMVNEQAGLPHLAEHAEAELRLAWLAAEQGRTSTALTKALAARRTFLSLGKRDRYDQAGALIAGLETAAPRLPLADIMAGCAYPAY